jgi:hypothetical protein
VEVRDVDRQSRGVEVLREVGVTERLDAHADLARAVLHGSAEDLHHAQLAAPELLVVVLEP